MLQGSKGSLYLFTFYLQQNNAKFSFKKRRQTRLQKNKYVKQTRQGYLKYERKKARDTDKRVNKRKHADKEKDRKIKNTCREG